MSALKNIKIKIELTSKCKQGCFKCPRTLLKGLYEEIDISLDYIKTICEAQPEKILLMGNLGDPIYHSKFPEIIKMIDQYNIPFNAYTVGSGYDENWWRDVYNSYNTEESYWFFDIDGTEETAGTYRFGLNFKEAFTAMNLGVNMGKNITWVFPVLKHNQNEIQKAKDLSQQYGINFRINYSERWDKDDPWKPTISLKDIYDYN